MDYKIKFRVYGTYTADISAYSLEQAITKAEASFSDAEFCEAENIDGEIISIENEDGIRLLGE